MQEWKTYFVDLDEVIYNVDAYYAHSGNPSETLKEHTNLCEKYLLKIMEEKKLLSVIQALQENLLEDFSEEGKKCFMTLFMNTITFHDTGKTNLRYQKDKMGQQGIDKTKLMIFQNISSDHSMLSAIYYMEYFWSMMDGLSSRGEKKRLTWFLLLNAYIISRHHGKLKSFDDFVYLFQNGSGISTYEVFEESDEEFYKQKIELNAEFVYAKGTRMLKKIERMDKQDQMSFYAYEKLVYSLLVTCDYYATAEYMSAVVIKDFGNVKNLDNILSIYKKTEVSEAIADYEENTYHRIDKNLSQQSAINVMRNEMFLDTKYELLKYLDESVFFLEAPTGSGKSNTALNLSFELLKKDEDLQKIFYVYPYNTLVEQNRASINEVFGSCEEVMQQIAVLNSTSPIKVKEDSEGPMDEKYVRALLDHQFINAPIVLTTHVNLFRMIFGTGRNDAGTFLQLANSVIVLDEIQSYKNEIWSEIIIFLKHFAKVLNIKVIIMSATLPDFDILTHQERSAVRLVCDRNKYFAHPLFKDRVKINYEFMKGKMELSELVDIVTERSGEQKKILVEFITKKRASEFYELIKVEVTKCSVELMTGDDSIAERERILDKVRCCDKDGIILVATQVVEAGVDIDMDIGYKNYSKLDSEEQFMGRINRSCKRTGEVYFFDIDDPGKLYKGDIRINDEFTIKNQDMQLVLENKKFGHYYTPVLNVVKDKLNNSTAERGLDNFFKEKVGRLDFEEIRQRMRLIEDSDWSEDVYLGRVLEINGEEVDGNQLWYSYRELLDNNQISYSQKQVELSIIKSKMNHFIYQVKKGVIQSWNDRIGNLSFRADAEEFFEGNKFIRERFESQPEMFM